MNKIKEFFSKINKNKFLKYSLIIGVGLILFLFIKKMFGKKDDETELAPNTSTSDYQYGMSYVPMGGGGGYGGTGSDLSGIYQWMAGQEQKNQQYVTKEDLSSSQDSLFDKLSGTFTTTVESLVNQAKQERTENLNKISNKGITHNQSKVYTDVYTESSFIRQLENALAPKKQAWSQAYSVNDTAGMEKAHQEAVNIRRNYADIAQRHNIGFSWGGEDNEYLKIGGREI